MQRSSSSIAALATALAKAQIELTNPEKSLIGTDRTATGAERCAAIPLCAAVQRAGNRTQDSGPA